MRVGLVATGMLLAVGAAAIATAALSQRAHAHQLAQQAEAGADAVRARYRLDVDATYLMLRRVCDGDGDVRAAAHALATPAWVVQERDGKLQRAVSEDQGAALPSLGTLEAARTGYLTFVGATPLVLMSCMRTHGGARQWVVRAEPLDDLRARLVPPEPLLALTEAEIAHTTSSEHADALALTIAGGDGAPAFPLWLRADEAPSLDALLVLVPPALLALLLAGLVAYLLARRGVDESVLVELERAAQRVAGGDLDARITLRTRGRADQTFQTFDRMTAELAEMRGRLAEAERAAAWQDMAQRIAHEIKNPLSPIQLAIETLRKAREKKLASFDEIFDESTRAILEEVRRLQHIVREFSEFARLPRARPGALSLAALVDNTVSLYRPDDVAVQVIHDDGPVDVRADREQLTQVLVNLLQNALDAARGTPRARVEVRTARVDQGAVLHVDDSGAGIAAEDRERVFQPYFTTKTHGTGLGLAIVRRIVVDHGGSVQVGASPLGGARFTITLPRRA